MSRQSDILWEWGYLITNYKKDHFNTIVFSLEDFFVEILVFVPGNRTVSVKALEKNDLDPACLQQIKENNSFFYNMLNQRKLYSKATPSFLN